MHQSEKNKEGGGGGAAYQMEKYLKKKILPTSDKILIYIPHIRFLIILIQAIIVSNYTKNKIAGPSSCNMFQLPCELLLFFRIFLN